MCLNAQKHKMETKENSDTGIQNFKNAFLMSEF